MLKGKSVIELTDVHTGKKDRYEDTNLVQMIQRQRKSIIQLAKRCQMN